MVGGRVGVLVGVVVEVGWGTGTEVVGVGSGSVATTMGAELLKIAATREALRKIMTAQHKTAMSRPAPPIRIVFWDKGLLRRGQVISGGKRLCTVLYRNPNDKSNRRL